MPGGRPKGTPKTGGRVKGTPNKLTYDVRATLQAMGVDPFEGMAKLAMDPEVPPEIRGRMHAELAKYVAPQLRSIEHKGIPPTAPYVFAILTGEAPLVIEGAAMPASTPLSIVDGEEGEEP